MIKICFFWRKGGGRVLRKTWKFGTGKAWPWLCSFSTRSQQRPASGVGLLLHHTEPEIKQAMRSAAAAVQMIQVRVYMAGGPKASSQWPWLVFCNHAGAWAFFSPTGTRRTCSSTDSGQWTTSRCRQSSVPYTPSSLPTMRRRWRCPSTNLPQGNASPRSRQDLTQAQNSIVNSNSNSIGNYSYIPS